MIEHGGTWIDATILCTKNEIPQYMLDSEFFIPRTIHEESMITAAQTVSYFISATQNNKILLLVRDLLYYYLEKNDTNIEYLLIYYFMELAIRIFPEEWNKVVPFPKSNFLVLADNLSKPYTRELYEELTAFCPFHKLTYRFLPEKNGSEQTILDFILNLPK